MQPRSINPPFDQLLFFYLQLFIKKTNSYNDVKKALSFYRRLVLRQAININKAQFVVIEFSPCRRTNCRNAVLHQSWRQQQQRIEFYFVFLLFNQQFSGVVGTLRLYVFRCRRYAEIPVDCPSRFAEHVRSLMESKEDWAHCYRSVDWHTNGVAEDAFKAGILNQVKG